MKTPLATVILAAGKGTRMKSNLSKVLHPVAGRPMVEHVVQLAKNVGSSRIVCVLGHQADAVQSALDERFGKGTVEVALQMDQRGTGHAVLQAAPLLTKHEGLLLVLYGDVPLLLPSAIEKLVALASATTLAIITTRPQNPVGYGRIVRNDTGEITKVVEEKDCDTAQRAIGEVNAGIYCGPARFMLDVLGKLQPNNAQGEIYLTDVVEAAAKAKLTVTGFDVPFDEVLGVNDRIDLSAADRLMRLRIAHHWMREGVTIQNGEDVYIEPQVTVGRDTTLGPGVQLRGNTTIGEGCVIDAGCILTDVAVGARVRIKPYCVLSESRVGDGCQLGPWAHLRPGSELANDVHLGNFVETKKTIIGKGSKANHLSYLGDATIGDGVNIGCGTITCNYDGFHKHQTIIEDDVFIGSDTQLVAPVRVGKGAITGAGTTVYENVPPGALALTRPKQVNIEGYSEKRRQKAAAFASKKTSPAKP